MSVSVLVASELELSRSLESAWLNDLPPARRAQVGRWPMRRDRQRSLLASRLLLVHLRRLGHPASALATLRYPPRSRPTLDLPLQWSLSHCEGLIVAAVSTEGPVGVDVEALGRLQANDFALYLNAAERAWAGRSAGRFYSVWTRKEAVAKAAGTTGLPGLAAVDTTPGLGRAAFAGRLWRTARLGLGAGHVGHVAIADLEAAITVEHLCAEALSPS
ncbi:MAG: 4'-phosphopantetheinyl transferase superfamily protein [Caldimonas sp.]